MARRGLDFIQCTLVGQRPLEWPKVCRVSLNRNDFSLLLPHLNSRENQNELLTCKFNSRFEGKLRTREEGADTVIWLALQPKEKLVPGAFYFDRAEAPKHLLSTVTGSHSAIDSMLEELRSMSGISS